MSHSISYCFKSLVWSGTNLPSKLKSSQISISSRRKSSMISCLVASFFPKFPRKDNFPRILKDKKPKMFSIWICNHRRYTLLSTRSLKTWCPTYFDVRCRYSQQSFQTVWVCPFSHPMQRNLKSKSFISFNDSKYFIFLFFFISTST